MKPEQIRIKIAEAVGKTCKSCDGTGIRHKMGPEEYHSVRNSERVWRDRWPIDEPDVPCAHDELPDYTSDLNAAIAAVESLPYEKQAIYMRHLTFKVIMKDEGVSDFERHNATAAQRCEAFLRTIGQWEDEPTDQRP